MHVLLLVPILAKRYLHEETSLHDHKRGNFFFKNMHMRQQLLVYVPDENQLSK